MKGLVPRQKCVFKGGFSKSKLAYDWRGV